mmetsp:Transcript_6830/g.22464  ORF Transcript_6830/g.22464 Transcript_6830/m.22464 type:complete len:222 (-) Transcript_6830:696-1361(-)
MVTLDALRGRRRRRWRWWRWCRTSAQRTGRFQHYGVEIIVPINDHDKHVELISVANRNSPRHVGARLRNIDRTTLKRRWSSGQRVQNLRRRPLHLRVGVQDVKGLADFVRIDDDFQTRPLQHGVKRRRGRNVVDEINVNHRCGRHHVLQIVFSHDKNNKLRAFAKARNRARRSAAVSDIQAPKGAQKRNARQRRLRLQHRSARHGHRRCAIVHGIIRHAGF